MNCGRFQKALFEYADGTLSTRRRAAADEHLAGCSACRQALLGQQQFAQGLSDHFRRSTAALALDQAARRRIESALDSKSEPVARQESIVFTWKRLAWPLGIAASVLVLTVCLMIDHFSGARGPWAGARHDAPIEKAAMARSDGRDSGSAIAIEVSYRVPTYRFRREGDLVVDTLLDETVVASGTLWPVQQPVQTKPEKKM